MNSANAGSGNQKPSFQTNVNRAKTKRWVEAKSYSYDGDDWGDDDYDEYDQSPPPPPLPPVAARTTGLRKPSQGVTSPTSEPSSGRLPSITRESTPQDATSRGRSPPVGSQTLQDTPNRSVTNLPGDTSSNDGQDSNTSKPLPFIRPADIYKRMEEERARERQSQDSSRPSVDASAGNTATSQLPEVQTGSSFGADFLSQPGETQAAPTSSSSDNGKDDPDQPDLQHNPSLGFRSVVHQAFDSPANQDSSQTPSSATDTDTVMRSNSDGTSTISPIISSNLLSGTTESHTPDETKTPTIEEEPREVGADTAAPGNETPEFKPGHRRDLSTPSPGNSPARRPVLSSTDHLAKPELGDLSSISSSDSPAEDSSVQEVASPDGTSTPKPTITTSSPMEPLRPLETHRIAHDDYDTYAKADNDLPTMSTETSPQDMESDRLRKEIFRSLSPQRESDPQEASTPSEPRSRIRHESTLIPSEYDTYWNDSSFHDTAGEGQETGSGIISGSPIDTSSSPVDTSAKALPTIPDATTTESPQPQSALRRNFSWEDLGQADSPPQQDMKGEERSGAQAGPTTTEATHQPDSQQIDTNNGSPSSSGVGRGSLEQGGLALVAPNPEIQVSPGSSEAELARPPQSAGSSQAHQDATTTDVGPYPSTQPAQTTQSASDPRVPGFREILLLTTPNERIHMFDDAREQFAATDPGLENWLKLTIQALPEHSGLVGLQGQLQTSSSFHRPMPSRNKFPKLPSLANLSLQTSSTQDNSPQSSTPTHGRNPSSSGLGNVITGQHVQAKGKDILHSAGVLGGKAGGAAKGLFAKSRSRFRGSGSDKVLLPPPVSGSYQPRPSNSTDSNPSQNGTAWPQHSPSVRRNLRLSTMSMGDTTASLFSVPDSPRASGDLSSATTRRPLPWNPALSSADVQEEQAADGSENSTTLPTSGVGRNARDQSTSAGGTSTAPPFLDVDIANPSIGEHVVFSQPNRMEGQSSPEYQVSEISQERSPSKVHMSRSSSIRPVSYPTAASDTTDETESIHDEKNPGNSSESQSHPNARSSGLPTYEAVEPPVQNAQRLQVENPASNHRRFSFEDDDDDDDDELILENNHSDQQRHVDNQMQLEGIGPRDEKRGSAGYPAANSPPPAPPYTRSADPTSYAVPATNPPAESFVQAPGQYAPQNPVHQGYDQYGNDLALHNSQAQHLQMNPAVNSQNNGYQPQHAAPPRPANYPYIDTSGGQPSSMPVFPPYRSGSWVSSRPQNQGGNYSSTEVEHPSYPARGAAYPPPQPHGGWSTTPRIQPDPAAARSGYLDANHTPGGSHRPGSYIKPDSDSQKSAESMMVNAAASRTDLAHQDKAASAPWKDGISKMKKRNKLQRASTSRDTANPDNTVKKGFSRLSGLFGRSSTSASPRKAPFIPKLSSPAEQTQQQRSQTFNGPPGHPTLSASARAQTFAGRAPPVGGYYAPDNPVEEPDDEIDESPPLERSVTGSGNHYGSYQPGSYQPVQSSQGTSPTYQVSPTNVMRSNEYQPHQGTSPTYQVSPTNVTWSNDRQPRWNNDRSHTKNMHMRSRSPRAHPPRPEEYQDPTDSRGDPASNLGTFYSVVPATPRVGDQERPWNITLPDDGRRLSQDQRPLSYIPQKLTKADRREEQQQIQPPLGGSTHQPTINPPIRDIPPLPPPKDVRDLAPPSSESKTHTRDASRTRGPSLVVVPPTDEHRDVPPARKIGNSPVELPVSGDTSDDEIIMSPTAYPGQEWQPSNLGQWD